MDNDKQDSKRMQDKRLADMRLNLPEEFNEELKGPAQETQTATKGGGYTGGGLLGERSNKRNGEEE